jgi:hypothetical protein
MKMPRISLAGAGFLWAALGIGQCQIIAGGSGSWNNSSTNGFRGSLTMSPPSVVSAVTGAPYYAETVTERVQTLADGTHITQKTWPQKTYRDSQGRVRIERPLLGGPTSLAPESPLVVQIVDPVANVAYVLDTVGKVTHRMALRKPPQLVPIPTDPATRPGIKQEDLGGRMIQGVMTQGMRTTRTFPVGAQGNDRPMASVTEVWQSPELKVTVLAVSDSDGGSNRQTTRLENLNRQEPNPLLFLPPADYQVVEETGQFTIRYP